MTNDNKHDPLISAADNDIQMDDIAADDAQDFEAAAPIAADKPLRQKAQKPKNKKGFSFLGLIWFLIKWGSLAGIIIGLVVVILFWLYMNNLSKETPDAAALTSYEPEITTRVHAGDGTLVAEFARERRLFVPVAGMNDYTINAFISAEDKSFYKHGGLDYKGMTRANLRNLRKYLLTDNRNWEGGSTITQQVAKNFLLNSDQELERKLKEMIIAKKMESLFSKDHILELYLNEIYLGNRSYGVAAAALNYFEKSLDELTISESAYIATLAKAPSNYHPIRNEEKAIERRNWIIGQMHKNGYITEEEMTTAQATPLGAVLAPPLGARKAENAYFAETVRRQVSARYGSDSLYDGGLSVRTTLNPRLQDAAHNALKQGLVAYDMRHGYRGALGEMILPADLNTIDDSASLRDGETAPLLWQSGLKAAQKELIKNRQYAEDLEPWEIVVILNVTDDKAEIGFADGRKGHLNVRGVNWAHQYVDVNRKTAAKITTVSQVLTKGEVILVEPMSNVVDADTIAEKDGLKKDETAEEGEYFLRQVPTVNGAMIAMDPHTGRVLAMSGGFSFGLSEFNRATQAKRQPGSTFKPFVYAAAIDNGYTPSSIKLDSPFVAPGFNGQWWKPANYAKDRFYGESTLRAGIERSRNTMTARLAMDIGIQLIIDYAEDFGVSKDIKRELAISLGAHETKLIDITTAYGMFVNGGRRIEPVFIDRVQDRYGKSIYKRDDRFCRDCNVVEWSEQLEPHLPELRDQVIDPRTAYQMVSIMEGVVQRGTGTRVKKYSDYPLAGKTGTTDDYKDAWFIGFSPDLVAGVYVGFDMPATMGANEGGGSAAAPIFGRFMQDALAEEAPKPFRIPSGIRLVRVNYLTGKPALPGDPNVILEAFKAEDDIYGNSAFELNGQGITDGLQDLDVDDGIGGIY